MMEARTSTASAVDPGPSRLNPPPNIGPGSYRSPRHTTLFGRSFLELKWMASFDVACNIWHALRQHPRDKPAQHQPARHQPARRAAHGIREPAGAARGSRALQRLEDLDLDSDGGGGG